MTFSREWSHAKGVNVIKMNVFCQRHKSVTSSSLSFNVAEMYLSLCHMQVIKNDMKRSKSGTPLTRCIFSFMENHQQMCDCDIYTKKYASELMWRQQCYRKEKLSMNKTPSCTQLCDIDKMSNNHNKNNPNELVKLKWKQDEKTVPSTSDDTIIKRLNTFDL